MCFPPVHDRFVGGVRDGSGRAIDLALVLSCEHGGKSIPARYAALFRAHRRALDGHRGYDAGSLELARRLARDTGAPLFASTVSRLLVDLNRSLRHRAIFSDATRALPAIERERIIARYYLPHRLGVRNAVAERLRAGLRVVHLSIHSFTPVMAGKRRNADVGLLYDPSRRFERELSVAVQQALGRFAPETRVRRNYPYRGIADGHTTSLRREFSGTTYAGIEIEINQAIALGPAEPWRRLQNDVARAVRAVILGGGS